MGRSSPRQEYSGACSASFTFYDLWSVLPLTHANCLENVVCRPPRSSLVPDRADHGFLKALPDPALGQHQEPRTSIGCIFTGKRTQGKDRLHFNVCDHEECRESARRPSALHHRRSGDDQRGNAADWQVERQAGRVRWRSLIPIRTWALNKWGLPWRESTTSRY